ncbi:MAG: DUF2513 domain-containing protein [Phascolarctobacterium sp.]|nr:DUF2513 domain-containing protein [Phascolarctobacterium sp.]
MKRDLDLMRQIMLDLEAMPHLGNNINALFPNLTKEDYEKISFHVALLSDAGYLKLGMVLMGYGFHNYYIERITDTGHQFIQLIREDTVWNKCKKHCVEFGASLTIEILKSIITGNS